MKKDSTKKALTAEELDKKFDAGEDITEHLDLSTVTRHGLEPSHAVLTQTQGCEPVILDPIESLIFPYAPHRRTRS